MKKTPQKLAQVRKALSGQAIPPRQTAAIRGGDGDDNQESYPWVDKP